MERPKTTSQLQQEQLDEQFARELQEQLNNSATGASSVPPPSTSAEASQEAADAALARQLQDEIDRREAAASAHAQRSTEGQKISMECPNCTFVNYLRPSSSAKHWKCSECEHPLVKEAPRKDQTSPQDLIECKVCNSLNRMPLVKSDAVLCGSCYQLLSASHDGDSREAVEEVQRTVQLRCGQCNVINAVTVGVDIKRMEFICGGCGVLNTMVLD